MEKIYNLIMSGNTDDFTIGVNLLLLKNSEDIKLFFDKYSEYIPNDSRYDIDVCHKHSTFGIKDTYIDCHIEYYFLFYLTYVRLRKKSGGINGSFPIITKEQFINGMY